MQFLTWDQAAGQPYRTQYQYRLPLTSIVFALDLAVFLAAAIETVLLWRRNELFGVILLGWCALWFGIFGLMLFHILRNRLLPSNWLARMQDDGILLKYRSYMNPGLPREDPVVVFIPFSEMQWIRAHRLSQNIPGSVRGDDEQRFQKYAEIKLHDPDTGKLEERLSAERQTQGQYVKTWYGSRRRGISRHYPVSVSAEGLIRVEWNVRPNLSSLVLAMQPFVGKAPAAESVVDFRDAETASPGKQQEMLLELLATGDRIGAIRAARHLYKFDTTRAVQFLEELSPTKPGKPREQRR